MLCLLPDEEFTVKVESAHAPKIANCNSQLTQRLGPDFTTDLILVETIDHARLKMKLCYNWNFKVDKENPEKLFAVGDYVGDMCNVIAGKVRTIVAS